MRFAVSGPRRRFQENHVKNQETPEPHLKTGNHWIRLEIFVCADVRVIFVYYRINCNLTVKCPQKVAQTKPPRNYLRHFFSIAFFKTPGTLLFGYPRVTSTYPREGTENL